jgi:hypothetical protein
MQLRSHTLRERKHHLDALFRIQVYLDSKFCLSLLETADLRVIALGISENVLCAISTLPSARYASAASVI